MNAKSETQNTTFKRASKLHNDCISRFKMVIAENFDNIIVGTLNINSISAKFDEFKLMVSDYFDVIIVTETKLDDSFPKDQFCKDGFSVPYRLDRNKNGRGLMIDARDDIPSKMLTKHNLPEDIETVFIELTFHKCKWVLWATYCPPSQNLNYFFDNIDKSLDVHSTYERVTLAGNFNAQVVEKLFDTFLYQHELTSINRNRTCCKNPNNPSCIDHILTNSPKSFFKTETVFTGLSDFHKLVLSVFKLHFSKVKAKEISHRNFRDFKENNFNRDLQNRLSAQSVEEYAPFEKVFLDVLNKHAPLKEKVVCANHAPYITKTLMKAIIKRSYLEKVYFKKKNSRFIKKFKKQKNYCSRFYKIERKKYFKCLDPRRISDNKNFWKNV